VNDSISIKNTARKNKNFKKQENGEKLTTDYTDYADFWVENVVKGVGL